MTQLSEQELEQIKNKLTNRSKYPWNDWLDEEMHVIVHGVDFDISVENMKASIYGAASKRGMSARTTMVDDQTIAFMATRDTHVIVDNSTNLRAVSSQNLVKAVELGETF